MATDLIRYDLLAQDALRGVVRRVLTDAARDGLPGDHHFYVTFDTRAPGVRLSNRMREKYPQEMTVVLQHQYWDLIVTEHTFEVGLSFGGIPERLLVPFEGVKGFFDPSVQFGLQFEVAGVEDEQSAGPAPRAVPQSGDSEAKVSTPAKAGSAPKAPAKAPAVEAATPDAAASEAPAGGAEVVSLDKFRKK
ncbi:Stringent starvation protein B [Phreatobacter aquaticus]|uniref:Stringent starvation protein B n=1 Tax=Phreatobacter aquaticus TaxID=2570229 RepID=A0A4D7QJE8_9HYPH|nr:SspB family protein [Phreatobacter aquaticus]QCK86043.1 Stringent starvation protein B [Phreatobacter aquaticus]